MTTIAGSAVSGDLMVRRGVLAYLGIGAAVLLLMMVLGLLLRLSQAGALSMPPDLFYQVMTVHGVGMVGIAGFGGAAIMWYFASQYLKLSTGIFIANLILFLVGVVVILETVFIGGFAGAWTFLFPLPAKSGGVWEQGPAAGYLFALLLIGVGFLLVHLNVALAVIGEYGGLAKGLGWPQLFGGSREEAPPPAVVASTMVLIVNTVAIVCGAVVLIMNLVNLYEPSFAVDALLAKNLTYLFGHVFINATIYMAIIAVYEILPRYTGRPWKSSRVFLAAWTASTIMVLIVYPHHLLMDFVMPTWMLVMGQIISYCSGLPVLLVTAYGTLTIIYRSGVRWDMASGLLFLAVFGWAAGVLPAIIDGTIVVNYVMHNTMWVPGHFHFYLMLGVVPMILGFMYFLAKSDGSKVEGFADHVSFWLFAVGTLGLVTMFLYSGRASVPRRWAVHLPEWVVYDQIASAFAAVAVLAMLVFAIRFLSRLPKLVAAS